MNKTLYIVRHAKASQENLNVKDWERPLIEIGIDRATKIAKTLKKKKLIPGNILSSHAFRALNTAVIFSLELDYPTEQIEINRDIYGQEPRHILDLIKKQNDSISSLMIFGHNPEFTELYNLLTGEFENLTTSSVAAIRFNVDKWSKIQAKKGTCLFLETGK